MYMHSIVVNINDVLLLNYSSEKNTKNDAILA